ncbi:hypothetical protein AOQ71_31680 [Bradyrhizobium manausense]|uniref:Uncharacterized protein n=2 Tax=Bradyrhizobium manausense TaxID=989370 RepID=A0A0R3D0Q2_9BRAD|nr:hypothetical protein AOQ71_31680 [Bradyrhizobium manausense]
MTKGAAQVERRRANQSALSAAGGGGLASNIDPNDVGPTVSGAMPTGMSQFGPDTAPQQEG